MKNSFSIGEISELLGIPKSTLRYWESEGLIHMPRNDENNYRSYNPSSIYTISDLAHYRCLRMSLQDMKRLPGLTPYELADTLTTLDQDLDRKLKELYLAKEYINRKMDCIEEFKRLSQQQYRQEEPDYDIYLFSIDDTDAWSVYIKDQYQSILLYSPEKNTIETGLAIPTQEEHPKLWERDRKAEYLSFVLKVEYSNPSIDDFIPHVQELTDAGHKVSNILARYLFSAYDGKYYDYYKAFAELRAEET